MSNINFSKEVINFIAKQKKCLIFVSDFTSYFDKLDHEYLKSKLKQVLGVNQLPIDQYTIFKNITKFCYINLDDILSIKNLSVKNLNKLDSIFNSEEFRAFKKNTSM